MFITFPWTSSNRINRHYYDLRKPFLLQALKRPAAVLNNVMENTNDTLLRAGQSEHDPQWVKDIRDACLIKLSLMCQGG